MSAPTRRPRVFDQPEVIGVPRPFFRDVYHRLLAAPWWSAFAAIALLWIGMNGLFAVAYVASGGIANSTGTFADAFFFSNQTMATMGYGAMYPQTLVANVLVAVESVVGLLITALSTGLVFAKFSVPVARVQISNQAVITTFEGVPTLKFRVANSRGNHVVEAHVRVVLNRTEMTTEGRPFFRMRDLTLTRERSSSFTRTWTVMHPIDAASPLYGASAEALAASTAQLVATLVGIDGTTGQTIHARYVWLDDDVRFGSRFVDMVFRSGTGVTLDFTKFNDLEVDAPN